MNLTTSNGTFYYSAFLLLSGLCGYLMGPQHVSTALAAGIGGGLLVAGLSVLNRRRVQWAHPALQTAIGVFTLTFAWRGVSAWTMVLQSHPDYLPIALLLSLMCLVSLSVLVLIFRTH